jgi:hypothetical protein
VSVAFGSTIRICAMSAACRCLNSGCPSVATFSGRRAPSSRWKSSAAPPSTTSSTTRIAATRAFMRFSFFE